MQICKTLTFHKFTQNLLINLYKFGHCDTVKKIDQSGFKTLDPDGSFMDHIEES